MNYFGSRAVRSVVFAAACLMAPAALAQSFEVNTSPGKRVLVARFGIYSIDTCYAGPIPEVRFVQQPQNGKLEAVTERQAAGTPACPGLILYFKSVYYTPKAGFRGADSMAVDFLYSRWSDAPGDTSRRQTTTITVK